MLRSLKGVYKASAVGTWFGRGPSPDPGPGAGVELGGGGPGGVGDLIGIGEGLPGQGGLGELPRDHRPELVSADDRGTPRRRDVELHDASPFGATSGSVLAAQVRVRRQRTFSASKIRRTWLRPAWMPARRAAWVRVSSVHSAGPSSSSADSSPAPSRTSRPRVPPPAPAPPPELAMGPPHRRCDTPPSGT